MQKLLESQILQKIVVAIVAVIIAAILLAVLKKLFRRHESIHGRQIHLNFLFNVLRLFIILLAFVTIGSQINGFGSTVTTIVASSGIVALGVSLAAQESLSNIIDGLFISIYKPFNVGDRVTLPEKNNLTGTVTEMNLRHTVITTFQNSAYIIPNSVMSSAIIDNSNFHHQSYAYPIDVSVSYDSNLDLAIQLFTEAVTTHPAFVDLRTEEDKQNGKPPVTVLVRNFGDSGMELRCQMVVKTVSESFVACSEVRRKLKKAFDANGIVIPYTTIHIDKS